MGTDVVTGRRDAETPEHLRAGGTGAAAIPWQASLACLALTALWIWLGWEQGGFFPVTWYPGLAATYAILLLLLVSAPWSGSLRSPAGVAVAALALLGLWAFASIAWSPAREVSFQEGQRVFLYVASFGIGLWIAHLLGRRMLLVLAPVVVAAAVVSLLTIVTVSGGTDFREYALGQSLRFPIGYHSSNAAYFLVAFWPAVVLAGRAEIDWRLRGALLGAATMFVELAILSQSRGSALASIPAAAVYLLVSSDRLRAGAFLGLALIPVLPALPTLLDAFTEAAAGEGPGLAALESAAEAIFLTAMLSVAIGCAAALFDPSVRLSPAGRRSINRVVAGLAVAALAIGSVGFVRSQGNPVTWVQDRYDEFANGGNPTGELNTRFLAGLESNRNDFWRVGLRTARDNPVLGAGPGGYQLEYLEQRRSQEQTHEPHSIELRFLSELGIPGGLLFFTFLGAAGVGAIRVRRLGGGAAALAAAALAASTYWLAHSSVDWLYDFPAITAPVMAMLGAAAAPGVLTLSASRTRTARLAIGAAAVGLAAVAMPDYLSARFLEDGYRQAGRDVPGAYRDFNRAADVNPLAAEPLLAEGALALNVGDKRRALKAFRRARERKPRDFVAHYGIGAALLPTDPVGAERALAEAHRLNPRQARVRRELERARSEISRRR